MKSTFVKSSNVVKPIKAFPRFYIAKVFARGLTYQKTKLEPSDRASLFNLASHRCAGFTNVNDKKRK
jgi:hypothetical protein